MKIFNFTINSAIFVLLTALSSGCKKFVEIGPPTTELVTASVFSDGSAATSAMTNIYSTMQNSRESANMEVNLGLLSDELTNYNSSLSYVQLYINAMTAAKGPGPWINAYNYIYQANAIIQALEGNSILAPAVVQQLTGEAKFVRAFWLFYLTNLYGAIPLVTTPNYSTYSAIGRTAQSEIYQQIVRDLKDAQSQLNAGYVDASDTTVTLTDRSRPNKWAATALLARTYLYMQEYDSAEMEAGAVIGDVNVAGLGASNGLYQLVRLDTVFLTANGEAIWQMEIPVPVNYSTPDGLQFILAAAPGGSLCCSLAPQLMSSFEANDQRRINWVDSFVTMAPAQTYYYPYKYKSTTVPNMTEETVVLRLAEQYLIRAEARAQQGNLSGAAADLNLIRNRAGLPNTTVATQDAMLSAILHERQVELFAEWGHRWLDLIRTNSADSVMSVVTPSKGGIWNADNYQLLLPIPQSERYVDANLTQNPGY
jgi:hypothetical protein